MKAAKTEQGITWDFESGIKAFTIVDISAKAGAKHEYRVIVLDTVGLKSKARTALVEP